MDAREFLLAVVPWGDGYTTIHGHRTGEKRFSGRSCRTVEEALAAVEHLKTTTRDHIYFCLTRQRLNSGQRSRKNAIAVCSLWLEGDVRPGDPKAFQTIPEAVAGVLRFCREIGIPDPSIIVVSGMGIHAYWVSDRTLTIEEWQPYADALINAVKTSKLTVKDIGVTGDAARVLRVPDTINWKYDPPQRVRILQTYSEGKKHDFAAVFSPLLKLAPGVKPNGKADKQAHKLFQLGPIAPAFAHLPRTNKLGAGIESNPPIPLAPVLAGCAWMREAYETGGEKFDEPQWNLTTLIATWMENGNELAHKLGDQHPDYSFEQTEKKWDRKNWDRRNQDIGWPACRTIQNSGSRHCASCPHFALGQSPLHLGLAAAADATDEEVEELGGKPSSELPKGFCLNERGRICAIVPGKATKGGNVTPTRILQLTDNIIRMPTLQNQQGQFGLGFSSSTDLNGWHDVFVPSSVMVGDKLISHLAAAFVMVTPNNKEANGFMVQFMVSWMQKLANEQKALRDAGTLGWRYEEGKKIGFVYGGVIHLTDGTTAPTTNSSDDEFRRWYKPVGRKEPWLAASKLLTDRKRPELDIIIAIAFASPLMVFTGTVYGTILSNYGEPGTGKSTAQQVAAAVWGHPKQTRESLNSTSKSVLGRLGRTKNLPAYWDDVQDERHQEALFQSMFVAAEGTEGSRLNPDATMKERKDWQTLLVACSNASFVEFLIKKQKSTTAGLRRVFEFVFNRNPVEIGMADLQDASRSFALLEHNYGQIGMEYASLLAREHEQIDKKLYDITQEFKEAVRGTADENFWWNLCGVLITGASLANRLGTEIDIQAMTSFLAKAYLHNRRTRAAEGTEGGSWTNTEQSLASFLNYHMGVGHVICTDKAFVHRSQIITLLRHPEKGRPVYVQVIRGERKVFISKRRLREWLQEQEIQSSQVLEGMAKYLHAREVKMTLGAGTSLGLTQEWCIEINIPTGQHLLEDLLAAQGEIKDGN